MPLSNDDVLNWDIIKDAQRGDIVEFLQEKKSLPVFSVDHRRTFCYIDDAITATKIVHNDNTFDNRIFNIGKFSQPPRICKEQRSIDVSGIY